MNALLTTLGARLDDRSSRLLAVGIATVGGLAAHLLWMAQTGCCCC